MKKIFYFLAISLLLIGCDGNNPESERPLNQPCHYSQSKGQWVIDTDWSPAGKKYINEYETADEYFVRVIEFTDDCNKKCYSSHNKDFSDPYDRSEGSYMGDYPNFTTDRGNIYAFKDTLTFIVNDETFKLLR